MTDPTRAARRDALIAAGAIPAEATLEQDALEYKPEVPECVRAGVYWATLGVAAASALVTGVTGIWTPDIAPQVLATAGVVTTVMGIFGGGVGVIYRPGTQR